MGSVGIYLLIWCLAAFNSARKLDNRIIKGIIISFAVASSLIATKIHTPVMIGMSLFGITSAVYVIYALSQKSYKSPVKVMALIMPILTIMPSAIRIMHWPGYFMFVILGLIALIVYAIWFFSQRDEDQELHGHSPIIIFIALNLLNVFVLFATIHENL